MKIALSLFISLSVYGAGVLAQDKPAGDFIVSGRDAPITEVAFWSDSGKPMVARGEDAKKAPAGAVHVTSKIFNMGGLTMREVRIPKGAQFAPPAGPNDTLIYVQSGRVKVKSGDAEREAGAGDTIREVAGRLTQFNVLEAAVFIEATIPSPSK